MALTIDHIIPVGENHGVFTKLDFGMDENDWSAVSGSASKYRVGFWEGKKGELDFPETTDDEACWIVSGRVAIIDQTGKRKEFSAGQGYFLPRGFAGKWVTVEDAKKIYVVLS